jgi:hypothetical protein
MAGSGLWRGEHSAGVTGRVHVEPDEVATVVDAVDSGGADAVGIIDGLEPARLAAVLAQERAWSFIKSGPAWSRKVRLSARCLAGT